MQKGRFIFGIDTDYINKPCQQNVISIASVLLGRVTEIR